MIYSRQETVRIIEGHTLISGDLKSKVKQLIECAGRYGKQKADISIAEQYYANHDVPTVKATQRFYRRYFGLCCEWYLEQKKMNWVANFEFALLPYLINGVKDHLKGAYFRNMSDCELVEIKRTADERCRSIGRIGYCYPTKVWISKYGKLYTRYEYQDEIECLPDVFTLIEHDLWQCKFNSAAIRAMEALDGKQ